MGETTVCATWKRLWEKCLSRKLVGRSLNERIILVREHSTQRKTRPGAPFQLTPRVSSGADGSAQAKDTPGGEHDLGKDHDCGGGDSGWRSYLPGLNRQNS